MIRSEAGKREESFLKLKIFLEVFHVTFALNVENTVNIIANTYYQNRMQNLLTLKKKSSEKKSSFDDEENDSNESDDSNSESEDDIEPHDIFPVLNDLDSKIYFENTIYDDNFIPSIMPSTINMYKFKYSL